MTHISELDASDYLAHSAEWHARRLLGIGGSDAVTIAQGTPAEVEHLRLVKLGKRPSEDLSGDLPVQMGSWTEPLNRYWLQMKTQRRIGLGRGMVDVGIPFMRANIDGVVDDFTDNGIVECKHVNDFMKLDGVLSFYFAQLQHCIHVARADYCLLSVLFGSGRHEWTRVERDEEYMRDLLKREYAFWDAVMNDTPIKGSEPLPPAIPLSDMREASLESSNSWAVHAAQWLELRDQAKRFDSAAKELKTMVEPDVRRAYGHGVEIVRDGRGLTLKATKTKPRLINTANQ